MMKPCPFCDSIRIATRVEPMPDTTYRAFAYCKECDARGPEVIYNGGYQEAHASAGGAWNVRAEVKS